MALVGPSGGQLLLGLLSGLSHLLSSSLFSSSHTSRGIAEFHVSDFRHDDNYFLGRDLPALERAIAMACFWGRPSLTILEMFLETVFCDLPLDRGILLHLSGVLFASPGKGTNLGTTSILERIIKGLSGVRGSLR